MITLQELIYDISQIWREDNKASFEQKYFENKTSIEHYTEQLHKPVVGGPASASVSEGEQLGNEAGATKPVRWDCKVCGKWFDENYELYDHYDTEHNKGGEVL